MNLNIIIEVWVSVEMSKVLSKKFDKFLKLRKNPKKERVQKYVEPEPYIL